MLRRFFSAELLIALVAAGTAAAEPLPGLSADSSTFTVSGISSGGYMAVQMHVAHSSRVNGVGAIAAGPYYCAQGSISTAMNNCMSPGMWSPLPPVSVLKAHVERLAAERRIDPLGYIPRARVWLFSGTEDHTVHPEVVEALGRFYGSFNTKYVMVRDKPAGHGMVTKDAGNACSSTEPPFIVDCDYDAAGEMLRFVLGGVAPPSAKESGRLIAFDQRQFADAYAISMADVGYVYVPAVCEKERCRVHVAFHGCRQSAELVGERFVRDAGYNRWADTNRLIVLYPQAIARWFWIYNPRGCWDWWGYSGTTYATKEGPQIRTVLKMVDRLSGARK